MADDKISKISKTDIIDAIYEETGLERESIKLVFEAAIDQIKAAICGGNTIELRGFGTFEVRKRKGRKVARNPRTGELLSVSSHGVAYFRPGQEIKKTVWAIGKVTENSSENDKNPGGN